MDTVFRLRITTFWSGTLNNCTGCLAVTVMNCHKSILNIS